MKILALSDIHGDIHSVPMLAETAKQCDVIAVAGDITDFGGQRQARMVLSALQTLNLPVVGVSGNCDTSEVDDVLREQGADLVQKSVILNNILFVGIPYKPSNNFISTLSQTVRKVSADKVVLVSHEPAWGTDVDVQASTYHKGNTAIRSFIEETQPALAISGHIHEAYGTDQLGDTVLVNPGPFRNGRYAIIDIGEETVQAKLHWL